MKNATRYCAGPAGRMCSTNVTVQNKPAAVAPKETITHHFFVSGIGRRKLSMQPKFVAAQKMLLKRNQQTFVMDCSVLILRRYTPLEALYVLLTIIA